MSNTPIISPINREIDVYSNIPISSPITCSICTMNNYSDLLPDYDIDFDIRDPIYTETRFTTECNHTFHQGCWVKYYDNKLNKHTQYPCNTVLYDEWYSVRCPNCRRRCYLDGLGTENTEDYIEMLSTKLANTISKTSEFDIQLNTYEKRISKIMQDYNGIKKNYAKMCEYVALINVHDKERLPRQLSALSIRSLSSVTYLDD